MKKSVKAKLKYWHLQVLLDLYKDYHSMDLMGETPIDALVRFYSREGVGGTLWHKHSEYRIRLQFFSHNGRIRCNVEIYSDNTLRKVECWKLPRMFSKKNWERWEDYCFVVPKV